MSRLREYSCSFRASSSFDFAFLNERGLGDPTLPALANVRPDIDMQPAGKNVRRSSAHHRTSAVRADVIDVTDNDARATSRLSAQGAEMKMALPGRQTLASPVLDIPSLPPSPVQWRVRSADFLPKQQPVLDAVGRRPRWTRPRHRPDVVAVFAKDNLQREQPHRFGEGAEQARVARVTPLFPSPLEITRAGVRCQAAMGAEVEPPTAATATLEMP